MENASLSTNQVCVLTIASAENAIGACTAPTIAIVSTLFDGPDGPFASTGLPQGFGYYLSIRAEGANYETYSVDVVSGPWTGNVDSGNAWSSESELPTWGITYYSDTSATEFSTAGTYTLRFTVTGCGGSSYVETTFTIVEGSGDPVPPPEEEPEYRLSLNANPWITDVNPDGIAYTHGNTVVIFEVDADGVLHVTTDESELTPSPQQYQWIYRIADPSDKPVSTDVTALYQVKFSVPGPPVNQTLAGLPWPWNWWHSKGRYTYESKMQVVAAIVERNRDNGGDEMDQFLPVSGGRIWKVYLPIDEPADGAGYGWMQPVWVSLRIEKIGDATEYDVFGITLGLGNDPV